MGQTTPDRPSHRLLCNNTPITVSVKSQGICNVSSCCVHLLRTCLLQVPQAPPGSLQHLAALNAIRALTSKEQQSSQMIAVTANRMNACAAGGGGVQQRRFSAAFPSPALPLPLASPHVRNVFAHIHTQTCANFILPRGSDHLLVIWGNTWRYLIPLFIPTNISQLFPPFIIPHCLLFFPFTFSSSQCMIPSQLTSRHSHNISQTSPEFTGRSAECQRQPLCAQFGRG